MTTKTKSKTVAPAATKITSAKNAVSASAASAWGATKSMAVAAGPSIKEATVLAATASLLIATVMLTVKAVDAIAP